MKKNSRIIVLSCTVFALLMLLLVVAFWEPLCSIVRADDRSGETTETATTEEPTSEETATDATENGHRDYLFFTYSDSKLGDYNFFEDCYEKAQQAVEDKRADSIMDYVLDEDFDHDALTKAEAAVEAGEVDDELEYMRNHEDSGKMAFLLYFDPMYAAAWGCYIDEKGIVDEKILAEEQDLSIEQRPDAAITRFIEDQDAWDKAIAQISDIIWANDNIYEIKDLDNYTSSMYAIAEEDGIPSVVVRNTENAGGHFIVISYKKADGTIVELKFRLECGYQPVDVPHWTPEPGTPKIPDNPKTPPDELESKDPQNDPWENEKFKETPAYEPDTTSPREISTEETPDPEPEKNNPDNYKAPEAPTEEATTETPKSDGTTVSPDSPTGSTVTDNSDGKTENSQSGNPATVTANDGTNHNDLNQNSKNGDTPVEDGVNSGSTSGDPGAPE